MPSHSGFLIVVEIQILDISKIAYLQYAAQAFGFGAAALDYTKEKLEEAGYAFPYDKGAHSMSAVQRKIMQMEALLDAARMLVRQCAGIMDKGLRNSLEASMAKAKAGRAVSQMCQRCVACEGL